jgi:phosphoribosylaminoimidazole-succinocarboxamide synthase
VELVHSGKVRELYADGADLIIVASDRMSIYDVVLPAGIPGKGMVLTQLSLWWFGQLTGLVPNHVISGTDVPEQWAGRAIRCRRLAMVPVECIARGYLAGLGLQSYRESGAVSGVALPPGLAEGSRLPEPVFTPTTKSAAGHDEPMTFGQVTELVGHDLAVRLRDATLAVYRRGTELAAAGGVLIADTKLEFGLGPDGTLMLADEVLTPDSSRFWLASEWQPGRPQRSLDKQFVRDWSAGLDWDRKPPGPAMPADVLAATQVRYRELCERLTGSTPEELARR